MVQFTNFLGVNPGDFHLAHTTQSKWSPGVTSRCRQPLGVLCCLSGSNHVRPAQSQATPVFQQQQQGRTVHPDFWMYKVCCQTSEMAAISRVRHIRTRRLPLDVHGRPRAWLHRRDRCSFLLFYIKWHVGLLFIKSLLTLLTYSGEPRIVDVDVLDNRTSDASGLSEQRADFRKGVINRDGTCVMTGEHAFNCDACHIIPHSKGDSVRIQGS